MIVFFMVLQVWYRRDTSDIYLHVCFYQSGWDESLASLLIDLPWLNNGLRVTFHQLLLTVAHVKALLSFHHTTLVFKVAVESVVTAGQTPFARAHHLMSFEVVFVHGCRVGFTNQSILPLQITMQRKQLLDKIIISYFEYTVSHWIERGKTELNSDFLQEINLP